MPEFIPYAAVFITGMLAGIVFFARPRGEQHSLTLRTLKAAYEAGRQEGVYRTMLAFRDWIPNDKKKMN